jgi:cytosine/adenosine deaminase-related metal-dependent hydrolase
MPHNAYRAKRIITLEREKPARGRDSLDAPVQALENAVLLTRDGRIEAVETYAAYRRRAHHDIALTDLGGVCIAPGLINAHCHLELSHLAGKTTNGCGFAVWVRSLLTALQEPLPGGSGSVDEADFLQALYWRTLSSALNAGTAHLGDIGSRYVPLLRQAAYRTAQERNMPYPLTHFLEVLGFEPLDVAGALPKAIAAEGYAPLCAVELPEDAFPYCAVAGHALYSTAPEGLRAALAWCEGQYRPFSLHLAESIEEEECLRQGKGALYDLLAAVFLPPAWAAPGLGAVEYAEQLGLLTPRTMAVHCVQCSDADIERLARGRTAVCLCPRSNTYIGVGKAPAAAMADAGIVLCLGTDGLSSNHDLDMHLELAALYEEHGFAPQAALRIATVNGAAVLGLPLLGTLEPGKAACFSLWDAQMFVGQAPVGIG